MSDQQTISRRLKTGEEILLTMRSLTDEHVRRCGRWEASVRLPCGHGIYERYALGWTPEEAVKNLRHAMEGKL